MSREQNNRSNPWKIVAIIFGSIVGCICIATIVLAIIIPFGLGATILSIWNNLVTPALSYNPPTLVPFQIPTVVLQAPNLNPNAQPAPDVWGWSYLSLYGFKVEIPNDWEVNQTNDITDTGPNSLCGLGHDLADYFLTSTVMDEVTIKFLCGPRGGEGTCPSDMVMLDEGRGIYRIMNEGQYYYGAVTLASDGSKFCGDGWRIDNVNMVATYKNSTFKFSLETVDRIILSVQEK